MLLGVPLSEVLLSQAQLGASGHREGREFLLTRQGLTGEKEKGVRVMCARTRSRWLTVEAMHLKKEVEVKETEKTKG